MTPDQRRRSEQRQAALSAAQAEADNLRTLTEVIDAPAERAESIGVLVLRSTGRAT